jgi:hypothetical protein
LAKFFQLTRGVSLSVQMGPSFRFNPMDGIIFGTSSRLLSTAIDPPIDILRQEVL